MAYIRGLMQEKPLLISDFIEYAGAYHSDREVVSRTVEGPIHRITYADIHVRCKRLANALLGLGAKPSDRIATLAWNTYRHFELYYGVSGMGAILHTVNPRLFPEQIEYILNHAEDNIVFFDLTFVPLIEKLAAKLPSVKHFVVMTDAAHMPKTTLPNVLCYETLLEKASPEYKWPQFDENTASALCYTSGTTGNPKGVLYSHRSTVLHALGSSLRDVFGVNSYDCVLAVVPLFHANAWGLAYSAPLNGAKLVLPGMALDGASVCELMRNEKVNLSLGVPTVWMMMLAHLDKHKDITLPDLKRIVIGGSAAPPAMIRRFQEIGVEVLHIWGMTELSPTGTCGRLSHAASLLSPEEQFSKQCKQGRAMYGVEMKIVDDSGKRLPHDGVAFGNLMVRGPWITSNYYRHAADTRVLDSEGYFPTGDVATIDRHGYMQITDRAKDVIKSGGEWISSIDLENAATGHPSVREAAVIGVAHPKWAERPLLLAVLKEGAEKVTPAELIEFIKHKGKLATWQLPDDVVFVASLPHTATGKLLKTALREQYGNYLMEKHGAKHAAKKPTARL